MSEMIRVCTPECLRTQIDVRVSIKGSCGWLITAIVAFVCLTISDANSPIMTNSNRRHRRQNLQLGNFDIDIARRNILHRDHSYDVAIPTKRSKMDPNLDMEEEDLPHRSKIWPPWPFNLIGNNKKSQKQRSDDGYPSTGALFWTYLRHRSRIGVRQLQQLGSELWFHLPPACPPLLILASIPLRMKGSERQIPTLISNPFVRKLVFASLGFAVMSWGHAELDRKSLLEPLPISEHLQDVARAILPPFLPEEGEYDWSLDFPNIDTQSISEQTSEQLGELLVSADDVEAEEAMKLPMKLRRHIQYLYRSTPKPQSLRSSVEQWRLRRQDRKAASDHAKRLEIYDQLITLQALKKRAISRKKQNGKQQRSRMEESTNPLGYALVTGASRGIGRALAVELARWEIPLILVARDQRQLIRLASDLERCYGVKCCVLPADLSKPGAAESIYNATTKAGLHVDVLVNNAGLSSSGEFVDMEESKLQEILQVNAMSVASLSHLYGSDMKRNRRGRILIVSSIVGMSYAGPTVAAYAATKAFEKVLGLSMAKELEVYGVGVTCLLPGAVGDSSFRKISGSSNALCWKIPFYVKSCESVADQGVRALLLGDLEVIPGWQNRAFAKILLPVLPQRGITLITEAAWNPLSHLKPNFRRNARRRPAVVEVTAPDANEREPRFAWPGSVQRMPPTIIKITAPPFASTTDRNNGSDREISESDITVAPLNSAETEVWILGTVDEKSGDQSVTSASEHEENNSACDQHPVISDEELDNAAERMGAFDPTQVQMEGQ